MSTYGTIPTSSAAEEASNSEYISRAKDRIQSGLAERRPWKEILDVHSIKLPSSFPEAISRVQINVAYFRTNYAVVALGILFLSLLWNPISLIVFIIMMVAWLFLYFLRDDPLAVFNHRIDDRVVLIVMAVMTIVFLLLTHATLNILVSLLIAASAVVAHAALRKTDDLFVDEEAAGTRDLMTGAGVGDNGVSPPSA